MLVSVSLLLALSPATPQPRPQDSRPELVFWDTLDEAGNLTGGRVELLTPAPGSIQSVSPAAWRTLDATKAAGNPANRIDLVFVGDGYTQGELGQYASQVSSIANTFFNKVPYSTYQDYFLVHQVDVVSNESGVDNDPSQGVSKDTALDMGFWCSGIERLLCVGVGKAYSFANNAPDVDLVCAIANSNKYGGAGYPSSDLATAAAGNGSSLEIVRHEFGHALGNLADEYTYGGPATYGGAEPFEVNVSKLTSGAMAAAGTKWAGWLGTNLPAYDGLVGTFEGGKYSQFGIYRPTNNSLMRNLGRPFNLPCIEKLIVEIYKIVEPIDASSDPSAVYTGSETLFVTPMQPVGSSLEVQWFLNGVPLPGETGMTLDLASLALGGGCAATVSVRVRDGTSLVVDEDLRDRHLTQSLDFAVVPGGGAPVANYCVTSPNSVGAGASFTALGSSSLSADDLFFVVSSAPASVPGLFFQGLAQTQTPLGNGTLCVAPPTWRLPLTGTDGFGFVSVQFDATNQNGAPAIQPGDTRYFQYWYRDPAGGGSNFNLSDGLSVQFCP